MISIPLPDSEPPRDCKRCPRLAEFRLQMQQENPDWWNAPVPAWGDAKAWLGIIGLAPGMKGANRTGRPFTGDYAGDLLYWALDRAGLSHGSYGANVSDGLELRGAIILNSVKCLPPQNKPTPMEAENCRRYLTAQLAQLRYLRVFIALGKIAHDSFMRHWGLKLSAHPFGHLSVHHLPDGAVLIDSYHCSRYNTQTGRLTPEMFSAVFDKALEMHQVPL
jgi:uracil-DNA glycosylase